MHGTLSSSSQWETTRLARFFVVIRPTCRRSGLGMADTLSYLLDRNKKHLVDDAPPYGCVFRGLRSCGRWLERSVGNILRPIVFVQRGHISTYGFFAESNKDTGPTPAKMCAVERQSIRRRSFWIGSKPRWPQQDRVKHEHDTDPAKGTPVVNLEREQTTGNRW